MHGFTQTPATHHSAAPKGGGWGSPSHSTLFLSPGHLRITSHFFCVPWVQTEPGTRLSGRKRVALNPRVTSELSPFPGLGSSGISLRRALLDTVRFNLLGSMAVGDGFQGIGLSLPWTAQEMLVCIRSAFRGYLCQQQGLGSYLLLTHYAFEGPEPHPLPLEPPEYHSLSAGCSPE